MLSIYTNVLYFLYLYKCINLLVLLKKRMWMSYANNFYFGRLILLTLKYNVASTYVVTNPKLIR